MLKEA